MSNETEPTKINVNFEALQAMKDFETLIKSEGTEALQSQWSTLKKGINELGTAPPPPQPPINFSITINSGPGVTSFGTGNPPPPPPVQLIKEDLKDNGR